MSKGVYKNTDKTERHASRCSSLTEVMASTSFFTDNDDSNGADDRNPRSHNTSTCFLTNSDEWKPLWTPSPADAKVHKKGTQHVSTSRCASNSHLHTDSLRFVSDILQWVHPGHGMPTRQLAWDYLARTNENNIMKNVHNNRQWLR